MGQVWGWGEGEGRGRGKGRSLAVQGGRFMSSEIWGRGGSGQEQDTAEVGEILQPPLVHCLGQEEPAADPSWSVFCLLILTDLEV